MRIPPRLRWVSLLGAPFLLELACSDQQLGPDQVDVVATVTDPSQDFGELRTYTVPDELSELCLPGEPSSGAAGASLGGTTGESCLKVDHSRDASILAEVREQMDGLGYVLLPAGSAEPPDIVILAGIVAQNVLFAWDGGVSWCDASPWYSGCWQPTYEYPYALQVGSVLIDLSVTTQSAQRELSVPWTAILANLLTFEAPSTDDVRAAVEQAFLQSPALERGMGPAEGGSP